MKFAVLAQSFNSSTGKPTAKARVEIIDTRTNRLFSACRTISAVHDRYEDFWNRLTISQNDLVLVQSIHRVK